MKIETLTEALRTLYAQFGNVIDIVAKKNLRAKGQAFVVYDNQSSANEAITETQGFELFGKPLKVALARSKSDKFVEIKGTLEELEAHKRQRQAEKGARLSDPACQMGMPSLTPTTDQRIALEAAEKQNQLKRGAASAADSRPVKAAKPSGLKSTSTTTSAVIPDEYLPPNKILFIQNLPEAYGVDELTTIFNRFDGFREVRTVPGRKGIAFIEYDAEPGAISAKEGTAGMSLGDKTIKVTYQRQ